MLGVEASKRMNNMIVVFKLLVIGLFIVIAAAHMDPKNWTPFMPFGWVGVAQGASLIFFAYLGFDAVSTSAEEAINPQRSLPIGIVGSLLVSTILYILVSGLLTGIVSYQQLNVASPISYALILIGYKTTAGLISVGAIAGLSTVILVLFYGLSRIFFAMARDGLLPRFFSAVNSKTQTPIRIILLCALVVGLAAGLLPIQTLADLVNIGTLFAFILVCSGVLLLRYFQPKLPRPFKTPFMPYTPILGIISCLYLILNLPWFTIWRFIIWFILGIVIYFVFARKHSILNGV
jgi:APA family basic amino acid/polyamine antiporter